MGPGYMFCDEDALIGRTSSYTITCYSLTGELFAIKKSVRLWLIREGVFEED
jgi:hypothetical protein